MRNIKDRLLTTLPVLFSYIGAVYINLEFNPLKWPHGSRCAFAIISIGYISLLIIINYLFNTTKK